MTISLKANAAGTQGEVLLNGTPVQTFNQNQLQVSGNVLAGAAQDQSANALTRKDYVDGKIRASISVSGGISSETGTINSGSWTGRYTRNGQVIKFDFELTITDAGTGSGALFLVGYPRDGLTLLHDAYGIGRGPGGIAAQAYTNGSNLALFKMDNNTIIANGTIKGSISYQVQ